MFFSKYYKNDVKNDTFFHSYNFEWTVAVAAAIFGNDNYVFWEVSSTPTSLSKIRWGYG